MGLGKSCGREGERIMGARGAKNSMGIHTESSVWGTTRTESENFHRLDLGPRHFCDRCVAWSSYGTPGRRSRSCLWPKCLLLGPFPSLGCLHQPQGVLLQLDLPCLADLQERHALFWREGIGCGWGPGGWGRDWKEMREGEETVMGLGKINLLINKNKKNEKYL